MKINNTTSSNSFGMTFTEPVKSYLKDNDKLLTPTLKKHLKALESIDDEFCLEYLNLHSPAEITITNLQSGVTIKFIRSNAHEFMKSLIDRSRLEKLFNISTSS